MPVESESLVSDLSERGHGDHKRIEDAARKLLERGNASYGGQCLIADRENGRVKITGNNGIPVLVSDNRKAVASAIAKCFATN